MDNLEKYIRSEVRNLRGGIIGVIIGSLKDHKKTNKIIAKNFKSYQWSQIIEDDKADLEENYVSIFFVPLSKKTVSTFIDIATGKIKPPMIKIYENSKLITNLVPQ